jgi:PhoPQ-activated pathogenicity-related protein
MKKKLLFILFLSVFSVSSSLAGNNHFICQNTYLTSHLVNTLYCAQQTLPILPLQWKKISEVKTTSYTQYTYRFISLSWPDKIHQDAIDPKTWTHEINIFIPTKKESYSSTAVLYVTGGFNKETTEKEGYIDPILSELIKHTIVIVLKNVPNQFLSINGKNLKEDQLIAYSWNKFILNPNLFFYPLHVPMAVAASKAMNLTQKILLEKKISVKNFVVIGLSKRGWTTWLTALLDNRVLAIIPIVTDILNMKEQLPHLFKTYGQHWPIAFFDYYHENIPNYAMPSNPFHQNYLKLLDIEDPFTYLSSKYYRTKLANIPKYIINSSGDDFFLPDASRFYFNDLPGQKLLFYVPNSNHYVEHSTQVKMLASSLLAFYNRVIHRETMPVFDSRRTQDGKIIITYQKPPDQLTFWFAQNPITRDFRYACGIKYQATDLKIGKNQTIIRLPKTNPKGWNAAFVTASFKDLQVSTPIFIYPETYPKENQIMPQQGACRLIL